MSRLALAKMPITPNPPVLEAQICAELRRQGARAYCYKRPGTELDMLHYVVLVKISGIGGPVWTYECWITGPQGTEADMSDFFNGQPGSSIGEIEEKVAKTLRHFISETR